MKSRGHVSDKTFFLVKYSIMSSMESAIFLVIILLLGRLNFIQAFLIGLTNGTGLSLLIARHFERRIDKIALRVCRTISSHPTLRKIVVKYM